MMHRGFFICSFTERLLGKRFLSRQLAVPHALNACNPVVVGDVDGLDALRVAAQGQR